MTPELRELLELSARAMGYVIIRWIPIYSGPFVIVPGSDEEVVWCPHHDRAQCFEMECQLKIDVIWWPADTCVEASTFVDDPRRLNNAHIGYTEEWENHKNDRAKARMMASLRVAAGIGRRMQG